MQTPDQNRIANPTEINKSSLFSKIPVDTDPAALPKPPTVFDSIAHLDRYANELTRSLSASGEKSRSASPKRHPSPQQSSALEAQSESIVDQADKSRKRRLATITFRENKLESILISRAKNYFNNWLDMMKVNSYFEENPVKICAPKKKSLRLWEIEYRNVPEKKVRNRTIVINTISIDPNGPHILPSGIHYSTIHIRMTFGKPRCLKIKRSVNDHSAGNNLNRDCVRITETSLLHNPEYRQLIFDIADEMQTLTTKMFIDYDKSTNKVTKPDEDRVSVGRESLTYEHEIFSESFWRVRDQDPLTRTKRIPLATK